MQEGEESARLCVFMYVCFVRRFPLAVLSDIWQGGFLACGQAERGKRSVRRQAAQAKPLINTLDCRHLTDTH